MTLPVKLPTLPTPPDTYSRAYFEQFNLVLNGFLRDLNAAGPLRGTELQLSNLPQVVSPGAGLRVGTLYNDGGTVRIVL